MSKLIVAMSVSLLAVLALALAAQDASVSKISTYGYAGRSGDATLLVDADVSRLRGDEKYVPLRVYLGHTGK